MQTRDALIEARDQGLDLIQISNGDVPVCRIGDAGKFLFERKKTMREQARRQREMFVEVKEVQLRPVTDTNDLLVKARRANDFLAEGDKVKVVVRFRGRERAHKEEGRKIVDEFVSHLTEFKIERALTDTGKDMQMVLAPTKTKAELLRDQK
jgi:translation initiation factor IF-3